MDPQPEIHVRGDKHTKYKHIGRVIGLPARRHPEVGFITEPDRGLARRVCVRGLRRQTNGNERWRRRRRRRADDGNEHDAVDRRPARSAGHVHHHDPGDDACREARHAAREQCAVADAAGIINLEIDFDGTVFWNGTPVPDMDTLDAYFRREASADPQPELHIRPSKRAEYDIVARVLASAQRNKMLKIGFVGNEQFM